MAHFQTPVDAELTITHIGGFCINGDVIASGPGGCTLLTSDGERFVSQAEMVFVINHDIEEAKSIQHKKHDKKIEAQHTVALIVEMFLRIEGGHVPSALQSAKFCKKNITNYNLVIECLELSMVDDLTLRCTFGQELAIKHDVALAANADIDDDSFDTFLQWGKAGEPMSTTKVENKQKEVPLGYRRSASGHGSKIPCDTMVKYNGVWRRVYAACCSNVVTHYVLMQGVKTTVQMYK